MLLGFFYSKFKSLRVHELELENKRKQRLEITRVENSKLRQRIRVKQLRIFSYQLNFMLKSQISHIGHKRCIPENEFFSSAGLYYELASWGSPVNPSHRIKP